MDHGAQRKLTLSRNVMRKAEQLASSLLSNATFTVRSGIAAGLRRKGGLLFIPKLFPLTAEQRYLMSLDWEAKTVYDVGGYQGIFTLFFARAVGEKGKVVTFEPNPDNYGRILENVRLNRFENVTVVPVALGRQPDETFLTFRRSDPGSGSLHPGFQARLRDTEPDTRTIPVQIDTMDNQVASRNLPKPDVVKIDVEGLEADVIAGMPQTLLEAEPDFLLEIHGVDAEARRDTLTQVLGAMSKRPRSIIDIEHGREIDPGRLELGAGPHFHFVFRADAAPTSLP